MIAMRKLITTCLSMCLAWTVQAQFNPQKEIDYCANQALKTISLYQKKVKGRIFQEVLIRIKQLAFVDYKDWCSGFWSGALWYLYEGTKNPEFKEQAERFDKQLKPLSQEKAYDHDLGFQIFCSYGNGYRLTANSSYKKVI
jgi:unsaturated chondroitin disaccharide hydrolase